MSKVIQLSRSEAWLHTWGFGWTNSYLTTPHSLLSLGLVIYSFFNIPSAPHIANTPVLKHTEAHIDTVLRSFLSDLLSPSTLHALKPTLSQGRHNLSAHHGLGKEDPRLRGQIICEWILVSQLMNCDMLADYVFPWDSVTLIFLIGWLWELNKAMQGKLLILSRVTDLYY